MISSRRSQTAGQVALALAFVSALAACGGGGGGDSGTVEPAVNAALVKYLGTWQASCRDEGELDWLEISPGRDGSVLLQARTSVYANNDCTGAELAVIGTGVTTSVSASGTREISVALKAGDPAASVVADLVQTSWGSGKTVVLPKAAGITASYSRFGGGTGIHCISPRPASTGGELCFPERIVAAGSQEETVHATATQLFDIEPQAAGYRVRVYTKRNNNP
jgi:hypothetical protein